MVAKRDPWDWEPWQARRASAPPAPPYEVREARADARLVCQVARMRLDVGDVPVDLAERLAAASEDPRVTTRRQLMAAEMLVRIRLAATSAAGAPPFPCAATGDRGAGDGTT